MPHIDTGWQKLPVPMCFFMLIYDQIVLIYVKRYREGKGKAVNAVWIISDVLWKGSLTRMP